MGSAPPVVIGHDNGIDLSWTYGTDMYDCSRSFVAKVVGSMVDKLFGVTLMAWAVELNNVSLGRTASRNSDTHLLISARSAVPAALQAGNAPRSCALLSNRWVDRSRIVDSVARLRMDACQRGRSRFAPRAKQQSANYRGGKGVTELPCLGFNLSDTLLPGGRKVLKMEQARTLALLDGILASGSRRLAHLTCVPSLKGSYIPMTMATLCQIEEVRRERIGAKVVIVGEGRLALQEITEDWPYHKANFTYIPPAAGDGSEEAEIVEAVQVEAERILALGTKLSLDVEAAQQVRCLRDALTWVDMPPFRLDATEEASARGAERAERLGFACLSACLRLPPTSTQQDLFELQAIRMGGFDPLCSVKERLEEVLDLLQKRRAVLAAKVALSDAIESS